MLRPRRGRGEWISGGVLLYLLPVDRETENSKGMAGSGRAAALFRPVYHSTSLLSVFRVYLQ